MNAFTARHQTYGMDTGIPASVANRLAALDAKLNKKKRKKNKRYKHDPDLL